MLLASCGGGGDDGENGGDGGNSGPNTPPSSLTSTPALLEVAEDATLTAQLAATDPNGDSLAFSVATPATHGTVAITNAGAVTYSPAANYHGADAFIAAVSDGRGGTTSTTFNVTVNPVNDPPVITGTSLAFTEDTQGTQSFTITDPEGDSFEVEALSNPAHGTLLSVGTQGEVSYQPDPDFHGQDSITVRAVDSNDAASAVTTITLNVAPTNDAPVGVDDNRVVAGGAASTIDVLANDTDIDGDALTISIHTPPALGTASVVNNQISFTPAVGYAGPASLVYRVSDAAGATADANLRLIVGEFQDVLFIEGEGRTRLHRFDGFTTTTINPQADYQTHDFKFSGDGRFVLYNQRFTQNNGGTLFLHEFAQPDSRIRLPAQSQGPTGLTYAINHDATWVFFTSRDPPPNEHWLRSGLIRLSDLATTDVIADMMTDIWPGTGVFNPVTDEFYYQARRSLATPALPGSQAFDSLYAGSPTSPAPDQIGADYPLDNGSGSGFDIRVTADGENVVHVAVDHTSNVASLLVNNRITNTETHLYRAFVTGEFPAPNEYDMNDEGTSVCFRLNSAGAGSAGPGRVWVASPASPGAATAVTPVADANFDCQFAADGDHIAYLTANGGHAPQAYLVDRTNPNAVTRMREPLASGQTTEFVAVAGNVMVGVVGVNPGGGAPPEFYRVDLDSPGTSVRFGSPGITGANPQYRLSADGNWLAYLKDEAGPNGTVKRLHLLSTRSEDFDLALGEGGVSSYGFRPIPK